MNFHVMTLFPEMIDQAMNNSILGKAMEKGLISLESINIRDYTKDKHNKVDDYTYGGGAGMLMQAQPVYDCYQAIAGRISERQGKLSSLKNTIKELPEKDMEEPAESKCTDDPTASKCTENPEASKCTGEPEAGKCTEEPAVSKCKEKPEAGKCTEEPAVSKCKEKPEVGKCTEKPATGNFSENTEKILKIPRVIYVTPQGSVFDQKQALELSKEEDLIFLCGHYEGIDERVLEEIVTDYISIGDYVLTGGELAAMVMMDAISRLVPGVLGKEESFQTESFSDGLLEYPQYSRPEEWNGKKVPEVLLSGHHKNIEAWRFEQSLERTRQRRPDLYEKYREENPEKFIIKEKRRKKAKKPISTPDNS